MDKSPPKPLTFKKNVLEIFNIFISDFENSQMEPLKPDPNTTMLIWDTVALFGLASFIIDYINFTKDDIPVNDVTKNNLFIGISATIHKFVGVNGNTCYLQFVSYHLPSTDVRLFPLHNYHHIHDGYYTKHVHHIMMHLNDHEIKILIDCEHVDLTILTYTFVRSKDKEILTTVAF